MTMSGLKSRMSATRASTSSASTAAVDMLGFAYGGGHGVALALGAAGDHDVGEDIGVLRHLVRYDGTDAAAADL